MLQRALSTLCNDQELQKRGALYAPSNLGYLAQTPWRIRPCLHRNSPCHAASAPQPHFCARAACDIQNRLFGSQLLAIALMSQLHADEPVCQKLLFFAMIFALFPILLATQKDTRAPKMWEVQTLVHSYLTMYVCVVCFVLSCCRVVMSCLLLTCPPLLFRAAAVCHLVACSCSLSYMGLSSPKAEEEEEDDKDKDD